MASPFGFDPGIRPRKPRKSAMSRQDKEKLRQIAMDLGVKGAPTTPITPDFTPTQGPLSRSPAYSPSSSSSSGSRERSRSRPRRIPTTTSRSGLAESGLGRLLQQGLRGSELLADALRPRITVAQAKERTGYKPGKIKDPRVRVRMAERLLSDQTDIKRTRRGNVVTKLDGKGTYGRPTVNQLARAADRGFLRRTRRGEVATAGQISARRRLSQAQRAASRVGVTGPLTRGQKTFVSALARETKMSPKVLGAWVLSEMSSGPAAKREAEGNHNWLNVGYFDSGPGQLTKDSTWGNPKSAAKATAQFLRGERFGASQGIQSILASSAGQPAEQQVRAIAGSGWASSQYVPKDTGGRPGDDLRKLMPSIQVNRDPGAVQELRQARAAAQRQGIPVNENPAGIPAPERMTRFQAITEAANALERMELPYVWGGGHGSSPVGDPRSYGGLDCSSTVSWVLQQAGYDVPTAVSGDMQSWGEPGPGAVTIFANPEHVFLKIGNRYFGTSRTNPGGGPGWLDPGYESEANSGKYTVRHLPGLGKETALALGIDMSTVPAGSGGAASAGSPGITYGDGGNTARINEGRTQDKPAFIDLPPVPAAAPTAARPVMPETVMPNQDGGIDPLEQSSHVADVLRRGR